MRWFAGYHLRSSEGQSGSAGAATGARVGCPVGVLESGVVVEAWRRLGLRPCASVARGVEPGAARGICLESLAPLGGAKSPLDSGIASNLRGGGGGGSGYFRRLQPRVCRPPFHGRFGAIIMSTCLGLRICSEFHRHGLRWDFPFAYPPTHALLHPPCQSRGARLSGVCVRQFVTRPMAPFLCQSSPSKHLPSLTWQAPLLGPAFASAMWLKLCSGEFGRPSPPGGRQDLYA